MKVLAIVFVALGMLGVFWFVFLILLFMSLRLDSLFFSDRDFFTACMVGAGALVSSVSSLFVSASAINSKDGRGRRIGVAAAACAITLSVVGIMISSKVQEIADFINMTFLVLLSISAVVGPSTLILTKGTQKKGRLQRPSATSRSTARPWIPLVNPRRTVRETKMSLTVSKTDGEYLVMIEGSEKQPLKLKHQVKVDERTKADLLKGFDEAALIASWISLSRSGKPVKPLSSVEEQNILPILQRLGRLMYRYLIPANIDQFFRTSEASHLWLEIDETLLEIPWELMHDGEDFVCLKYAVGRRMLTRQSYEATAPRVSHERNFLLIGDPSEELPEARDEVKTIARTLDKLPGVIVTSYVGSEISKIEFLQLLNEGRFDCIHYAGHASFDVEKPDESYLKFKDGPCYAYETKRLMDHRNAPKIVFVNACSSAKEGETTYEREIGGLAKSFLFSGCPGYIGAIWPVHDDAVAKLAGDFYERSIAGLSLGESLRQSRRQSFEAHGGGEIAWASFTLYGDPSLRLF